MRTGIRIEDDIAQIQLDDGKVNAMTAGMLEEICARLDEARAGARVTVIRGRPGIFSAGFDMPTFGEGLEPSVEMLSAGMKAIVAMLSHPQPIVAACTGHAYPMGAFLMLCADERYGVHGDYRIGMNEVAIGLTVPRFALELAKHRLSHAGLARVATGALFDPEAAVGAGYLDRVVPTSELDDTVRAAAVRLLAINSGSYVATKRRLNESLSDRILGLSEPQTVRAELLSSSNV